MYVCIYIYTYVKIGPKDTCGLIIKIFFVTINIDPKLFFFKIFFNVNHF